MIPTVGGPRVVGSIQIRLLETGEVQVSAQAPGGMVVLSGMMEEAKASLRAEMMRQRTGVEVAPPGLSVARNGG